MPAALLALCLAAAARGGYRLVASGAATVDLGVGRRARGLGPVSWRIAAPRETVFQVISAPYLERTPRALEGKLQVLERGSDLVLAAHFTPIRCGVATTVETVRFRHPERVDFRVVRGPVPHVVESFVLAEAAEETELTWRGELGTDLWAAGSWWGSRVAGAWEQAVRASIEDVRREAERRARQ